MRRKAGERLLRFEVETPEVVLYVVLMVVDRVGDSRLRALVERVTSCGGKLDVGRALKASVAVWRE
jgi:hypothetical protein